MGGGGGRRTKKKFAQGEINAKKFLRLQNSPPPPPPHNISNGRSLIVNNIRNVRRNLSVLLHKLSFGWSNGIFSPASMRRRGEGKHTARARKVMPIVGATENEILRNFILFYKKEELEENSIFCFISIQWHLTRI